MNTSLCKNNKLLTIVVPVYNMEEFLVRCLDSLVKCKRIDEMEVLVINDGSKDRSSEIAHEYEKIAPNSVRVIDKPNGGWGTAINLGIKEATGKYWRSVDSDDWVDSDELDKLVGDLALLETDVIFNDFETVYAGGGGELINVKGIPSCEILNFNDDEAASIRFPSVHGKVYKTSFLRDNDIKVSDRFYGDLDLDIRPLPYIETITYLPYNIYRYFLGRPGQSVSEESYQRHMNDLIMVVEGLVSFYEKNKIRASRQVKDRIINNIMGPLEHCYRLILRPTKLEIGGERPDFKTFDRHIKNMSTEIFDKTSSLKRKHVPYVWLKRNLGINIFHIKF